MKNKIKAYGVAFALLLLLLLLTMNIGPLKIAVLRTLSLWVNHVFPILFPFYILSSFFIAYGVAHFIGGCLHPLTHRLFKTKPMAGFIFAIAVLSGNPQSAILIANLSEEGALDREEAEHLLLFNVFVNPLFALGTIGVSYYQDIRVGAIVLIAHILANVVLGVLLGLRKKNVWHPKSDSKRPIERMIEATSSKPFGTLMTNSIEKGIKAMVRVGGFMVFFSILTTLLTASGILPPLHHFLTIGGRIPLSFDLFTVFLLGIFEMVGFVDAIHQVDLPLRTTVFLLTMFISFGGLSIHTQLLSFLGKLNISYRRFLAFRIYQMAIGGGIAYLIFPLFYKGNALPPYHHLLPNQRTLFVGALLFSILILMIHVYANRSKNRLESSE